MEDSKEHEYCLRCGRKLKNLRARERGYGITCFNKLKQSHMVKLFNDGNLQSSKKEEPV